MNAGHDKLALLDKIRSARSRQQRYEAHLQLLEWELEAFRRSGLVTVQLWKSATDKACERCDSRNGSIVSVNTQAAELLDPQCPRLAFGMCSLSMSAWIKRPDGTGYCDRQPKTQPRH